MSVSVRSMSGSSRRRGPRDWSSASPTPGPSLSSPASRQGRRGRAAARRPSPCSCDLDRQVRRGGRSGDCAGVVAQRQVLTRTCPRLELQTLELADVLIVSAAQRPREPQADWKSRVKRRPSSIAATSKHSRTTTAASGARGPRDSERSDDRDSAGWRDPGGP